MHVLDACNFHVSLGHCAIEKPVGDSWSRITIIKCLDFGWPFFEIMSENNYEILMTSFSLILFELCLCWFTWVSKDKESGKR